MFISKFRTELELRLQNEDGQQRNVTLQSVPNHDYTYRFEPNNNDNLIIVLNYNDPKCRLAIALYVDGLNTMQEGAVLPNINQHDMSAHATKLVGNYGSNVYIKNWKTDDGTNPKITFTNSDDKMVRNYINNADLSEQNTIRLFLWISKRPVERPHTVANYTEKGNLNFGVRGGFNDGSRSLGGAGLGANTNTQYTEVDFENPEYLGCITIFYKVKPFQLPKFDESYFNDSPFQNVPRV